MTSAITSRVMSSGVGPMPPHTRTASLRASISRRALDHAGEVVAHGQVQAAVDARLGQLLADPGTRWCRRFAEDQLGPHRQNVTPHGSASAAPRPGPHRLRGARCPGPRPGRGPPLPTEGQGDPGRVFGERTQGRPHRHQLEGRLPLAQLPGGQRDPPAPGPGPVGGDETSRPAISRTAAQGKTPLAARAESRRWPGTCRPAGRGRRPNGSCPPAGPASRRARRCSHGRPRPNDAQRPAGGDEPEERDGEGRAGQGHDVGRREQGGVAVPEDARSVTRSPVLPWRWL